MKNWIVQHKDRKLSRTIISILIGNVWGKAATVSNSVAGFRARGIHPYNPDAIPDHLFCIADNATSTNVEDRERSTPPECNTECNTTPINTDIISEIERNKPSTSRAFVCHTNAVNVKDIKMKYNVISRPEDATSTNQETPSKFLDEVHPIPVIPITTSKRKQKALELTSPENKSKKKSFCGKKKWQDQRRP